MSARVLVVDDNGITRRLVRFTLKKIGLEVYEAARAGEVLPLAKKCKPELVLLDLVLPDGSGFEIVRELRRVLGDDVPILAFTGLLSAVDEGRLGSSGFDDVIAKPVEPKRLREILRAYLPSKPQPGGPSAFGCGRRLLVVDDDPVQRKLAMFRLSRLGFVVTGAGDGEEAYRLAMSEPPDAIVTDLLMPSVDGFELCTRLRSQVDFPPIPIIVLTNSYIEDSDRELAARVGASAYLLRTPELVDLIEVLKKNLEAWRVPRADLLDVEQVEPHQDRADRVVRQLERQVMLNSALSQRSAMLAAELTSLGSLTSALADNRDIESALDDALSACFDAGGISWGVLLVRDGLMWSYRSIGLGEAELGRLPTSGKELARRLGITSEMRTPYVMAVRDVFGSGPTGNVLVAPIAHRGELLGCVVQGVDGAQGPTERLDDHRFAFAGVVAGQIALVLALSRSFRQLERASEAERLRAQVLSSVLDAIGEPLLVLDENGFPSHANRAAQHLELFRAHGTSDSSVQLGLFHADQSTLYTHVDLPTARALRGEEVVDEEIVIRRPSQEPIRISVTAHPIRGADKKVDGAVAVIRDVTEERRNQARQITSDRLASIGVLAAGVAHEINNPLTSVLAELEMAIEDTDPNHRSLDRLRAARDAAERVHTIVRDLRTLSHNESDEVGAVELHRVLDTALRIAAPQTRPVATVVRDFGEVPPVMANEARLVQVVLNLVVNAAQAMTPGDSQDNRIIVRAVAAKGGGVFVEVADTGPGMTPEVRERLFTPFFTTKPVGTGTGLGLSICHRLISSIGGTIDCETVLGEGTTFRLWLPSASRREVTVLPASAARMPVILPALAIVDDPLAYQLIERGLNQEYMLSRVTSVEAALSLLSEDSSYVVILYDYDSSMAGEKHLYTELRWIRPELARRVVFLGDAEEHAPNPRLEKPFDSTALRRFVREHVKRLQGVRA